MEWEVLQDHARISERAAEILLDSIDSNPAVRLGLPTGTTPIGMYEHAVKLCRSRYHCFRDVITFNLDEYVGIPREHPGSYFTYMRRRLFDHVDLKLRNAHVPCGDPVVLQTLFPGMDLEEALVRECERYEREIGDAGGIDLLFLGLGRNAHIAFNEPGTPHSSRTHLIVLDESTRRANAPHFAGEDVPHRAITMGIATILEARRIVLLASGAGKSSALEALRSGAISEQIPASALHRHPDVRILCDVAAAGE
jgi:glucosamine-6-phosphate deaminase